MKTKNILYIVALLLVLGVLLSWNFLFPSKPVTTIADPSNLPGLQTSEAPWPAELLHLAQRLHAIGLPALSAEGFALHIHQHLDIFIDGNRLSIPAGIGINPAAGFISILHVHDDTGVIHVESPVQETFTLGQFFDVWGVRLTTNCIGSYCIDKSHQLNVYANGTLYSGNPRELPLTAHEEIAIVYSQSNETSVSVPSTYAFPAGE